MIELPVPKHLVIGPHEYKVSFKHSIAHEEWRQGELSYHKLQMHLDPHRPRSRIEATFVHESLHGIADYFNVSLCEEDVDRLANGLTMFLKDNFGVRFNFEGIEDADV